MTSVVTPETRFVRSGDVDIAYQVVGQGERDIVVGIGWVSHLELLWELPETVHFLRRLQSCGRLILYDARGTGLSDRPARPATIDDLAEDLVAVLDAVGSERAVILGWVDKAAAAIALAARHPERVEALVLGEALATTVARDDHPEGLPSPAVLGVGAIRGLPPGSWGLVRGAGSIRRADALRWPFRGSWRTDRDRTAGRWRSGPAPQAGADSAGSGRRRWTWPRCTACRRDRERELRDGIPSELSMCSRVAQLYLDVGPLRAGVRGNLSWSR